MGLEIHFLTLNFRKVEMTFALKYLTEQLNLQQHLASVQ